MSSDAAAVTHTNPARILKRSIGVRITQRTAGRFARMIYGSRWIPRSWEITQVCETCFRKLEVQYCAGFCSKCLDRSRTGATDELGGES